MQGLTPRAWVRAPTVTRELSSPQMYGYNAVPLPCLPPLLATISTTNRKEKTMPRFRIAAVCAAVTLSLTPRTLVAIQLDPVVTTGLASPLFVGHAGDGSRTGCSSWSRGAS